MRSLVLMVLVANLFAVLGCTHLALQNRTVNQASTVADLQFQQVLDNLAMFHCNPEALPWHVRLKDGVVQVVDLKSGGIAGAAGGTGDLANSISPGANFQRTVLGQWNVDPVVDDDELGLLRLAYAKAVSVPQSEALEEIRREIRLEIWKLVITYEFAPGATLLLDVMVDGLHAGFDALAGKLDGVPYTEMAKEHLKSARDQLEAAINEQRLSGKSGRHEQNAVVAGYLNEFQNFLELASAELINSDGAMSDGRARDSLHDVLRKVLYMKDINPTDPIPENLQIIITHLNPVISRDLELQRQAGAWTCSHKPRFEGYEAQVNFLSYIGAQKYLVPQVRGKIQERNAGLADQAKDKAATLRDLLDSEPTAWVYFGSKKDVPKCACYVGHYCGCAGEIYTWVMPEQMRQLREFTLNVLNLVAPEHQDAPALGAAFSPR